MSYGVGRGGFDRNSGDWDRHTETRSGVETFETKVQLASGFSGYVSVLDVPERDSAYVKVECNPSRFVDPGGWSLAPPSAVAPAVAAILSEVGSELVAWPGDELRVRRLDLARDFSGVERPGALIRALGVLPRRWARLNLVHADAGRGGAQTLMVGSRTRGAARLYDKHVETSGRAPAGVVRSEAEMRSEWCAKYGGIALLCDVDDERVERALRDRWRWSGMGTEVVVSGEALLERVARSGLSPVRQCTFLGWLLSQSCGGEWDLSDRSVREYRRLQRELGIVGADLFGKGGLAVSARLDFDEGTEVLRVA